MQKVASGQRFCLLLQTDGSNLSAIPQKPSMPDSKLQRREIDDKELLSIVRVFEEACGDGEPDAHYLFFGEIQERKLELVKGETRPREKE